MRSGVLCLAFLAACARRDEPAPVPEPTGGWTAGDDSLWHLYPDPSGSFGAEDIYCRSEAGVEAYALPTPDEVLAIPVALHMVTRSDGSGGLSREALLPRFDGSEDLWSGSWLELEVMPSEEVIRSDTYFDFVFEEAADYEALFNAHNLPDAMNVYFVDRLRECEIDPADGGCDHLELGGIGIFPFFGGGPQDRAIIVVYTSDEGVLAHEIGHFLGLLHTHETASGTDDGTVSCWDNGDEICDTPPDPGEEGTCATASDCSAVQCADASFAPDPRDVMSYYHDCRTHLTDQQIGRARCYLERGGVEIDIPVTPLCIDEDRDGYGEGVGCLGHDCDDLDDFASPATAERCDDIDNDCDADVDEGVRQVWYVDLDGDGHGDPAQQFELCSGAPGLVTSADDCDDLLPDVFPGALEQCNERDDDCDGVSDEGFDVDLDGFVVCGPAPDCDDGARTAYPGALEVCEDGVDQDCDGVDDDCLCLPGNDADGDNFGVGPGCYGVDCDDANPQVAPGAVEICDDIDQNCNGQDDAAEGLTTPFYLDRDGDGYGDAGVTVNGCPPQPGYVGNSVDCDDASATVNPVASEACNGVDDNCDGGVDEGLDGDGDGYTPCQGDCDDVSADVYPGAPDGGPAWCDGLDNDCDGVVDPDCGILISTDTIQLDAGGAGTVIVPKPPGASSYVAFFTPTTVVEDGSDYGRCDFETTIVEGPDAFEFIVTTTTTYATGGGGTAQIATCDPGTSPAFVGKAVVVAHTGGDGWVRSAQLLDPADSDPGSVPVEIDVPAAAATQTFAFCAWQTMQDDGEENDTSRVCDLVEDWGSARVSASLGDSCDNGAFVWDVDLVAIGLSQNVSGEIVDFDCNHDDTVVVSHLLGAGSDHEAIVLPHSATTGSCENHSSWSAGCTNDGVSYTCTIDCWGSQTDVQGRVLFLDGEFVY